MIFNAKKFIGEEKFVDLGDGVKHLVAQLEVNDILKGIEMAEREANGETISPAELIKFQLEILSRALPDVEVGKLPPQLIPLLYEYIINGANAEAKKKVKNRRRFHKYR